VKEVGQSKENAFLAIALVLVGQLVIRGLLVDILHLDTEGSDRLVVISVSVSLVVIAVKSISLTLRGRSIGSVRLNADGNRLLAAAGLCLGAALIGATYSIAIIEAGSRVLGSLGMAGAAMLAAMCIISLTGGDRS
jgi:hypothetical protein